MGKIRFRDIPPYDDEYIVASQRGRRKENVRIGIGHDEHPLRTAFADEYGGSIRLYGTFGDSEFIGKYSA